ncbi:MAG: WD40 repeat domain-containing serine/threonine-protein kinase, partial [Rubripirellula sp.]
MSGSNTPGPGDDTLASGDAFVCASCGFVIDRPEAEEAAAITDSLKESFVAQGGASVAHRRIAHFQLDRLLGKGGFGTVWLAEDLNLGRRVALKLPRSLHKDAKLVYEAQTAAKLKHPNIVSIYEVGNAGDQVYIASEFIDGDSMRSLIDRARLPVEEAVGIMIVVSHAVDHAHEHGVVHRDLKPANIMIDNDGRPHVTDFGIAKQLSEEETISTDGQVVGTVAYMSPEQAQGNTRETDHRSDVYALGTMLFELLTEYRPFRGEPRGILHQKIHEDPPSPRKLIPQLPRDLETICQKCLQREPAKRYQSAKELAEELTRFEQGLPIHARPVSSLEKMARWCSRNRLVCGLVIAVFGSLLVALLTMTSFWFDSERRATLEQESLYRTRMVLASNLWDRGDVDGVKNSIAAYAPQYTEGTLADFEWRYLDHALKPFDRIVEHGDAVVAVAISRDNEYLASAGRDRVIRVWEIRSGELIRTLQVRGAAVEAIEFAPTSNRLLSSHRDGIARLWNPVQHNSEVASFQAGRRLVHSKFHPSGSTLITMDAMGTLIWWDLDSKSEIRRTPHVGNNARAMDLSVDGNTICVANTAGEVVLLRESNGDVLQTVQIPVAVGDVSFVSPNSVVVAGQDRVATVDFDEPSQHFRSHEGDAIGDMTYLRQLECAAVVMSTNNLVLLDESQRPIRSVPTHSLSHGVMSQSKDGTLLAVGSGDGTVKVLRVSRLRSPEILWHAKHVRDVMFDLKRKQVMTCVGDGSVHLWDTTTGTDREVVSAGGREMLALAIAEEQGLGFAAGMIPEVLVIDLVTGNQRDSIALPHSGVAALDTSKDSKSLVVAMRSGLVLIYRLSDLSQPIKRLTRTEVRVNDCAFSSDGSWIAVAYSDRKVVVSRVGESTGDDKDETIVLEGIPSSLAYSEDGELIVVGTQSG